MKRFRQITALLLAVLLMLSLAACGSRDEKDKTEPDAAASPEIIPETTPEGNADGNADGEEEELPVQDMTVTEDVEASARLLVQGRLDEIYRGTVDEEYLSLAGIDRETSLANFSANLSEQTTYFAIYFAPSFALASNVELLSAEQESECGAFWAEVYSKARFTVGAVEAVGDGSTFAVSVRLEPLGLIQRMRDNEDAARKAFYDKYGSTDLETLSEEQLRQAYALWFRCTMELAQEQLEKAPYGEAQTLDVLVTRGEDGVWTAAQNDLYLIDELLIPFPELF